MVNLPRYLVTGGVAVLWSVSICNASALSVHRHCRICDLSFNVPLHESSGSALQQLGPAKDHTVRDPLCYIYRLCPPHLGASLARASLIHHILLDRALSFHRSSFTLRIWALSCVMGLTIVLLSVPQGVILWCRTPEAQPVKTAACSHDPSSGHDPNALPHRHTPACGVKQE